MRLVTLILSLLLVLLIGGGVIIGLVPMNPTPQHVEQRIPDAQIPR